MAASLFRFSVQRFQGDAWASVSTGGRYLPGVGAQHRPDAAMTEEAHAQVERAALWLFQQDPKPASVELEVAGVQYRVTRGTV